MPQKTAVQTAVFFYANDMLAQIKSPEDIKKLSQKELRQLADEIRRTIIDTVGKNGGHLASNLGIVELTIALHKVFSSPKDAIVFDVSHQCYAHKLLTGRFEEFSSLRQGGGISGFTKECESEHDFFDNGHASTSISQALGLLKAREIQGVDGKVIAVIGDGALTGGLAYEGLLNAGRDAKNLIVVLNDNQMSISPSEGSLSRYLSSLTMSIQYQSVRRAIDKIVSKLPGSRFFQKFIFRFKRGLKGLLLSENMFVDFGFEYAGPLNGHDIKEMEKVFERVKKLKKPVVVHVITKKGKGYSPAEDNPELFHGIGPFNIADGSMEKFDAESFTENFSRSIVRLANENQRLVAITAAMAKGTGLAAFARHYPQRFFDVGIAEEHAVTFAAGLAKGGLLPVVCIYSTFIQRAIDQIIHDICLPNLRAIFVFDRSGAVPNDGETHQGIFDIALLKSVPNLSMLAPASAKELDLCLDWAAKAKGAVAIRYPKKSCPSELAAFSEPLIEGRGVLVKAEEFAPSLSVLEGTEGKKAKRVLIAATGSMFSEVLVAARSLLLQGASADIYNLRFLKPFDFDAFYSICKDYDALVIVEDAIKQGGFAEELEAFVQSKGFRAVQVLAFGQKFPAQGSREQILENAFLSPNDIQRAALGLLNQIKSGE
ncbi:MAG: 1-deoxy-D-xylulose-5-phosphate synthase [Treponema sp.]|nr:1-deoxy-D-xylulose-5-phosphate synthase [Treponema sp.]